PDCAQRYIGKTAQWRRKGVSGNLFNSLLFPTIPLAEIDRRAPPTTPPDAVIPVKFNVRIGCQKRLTERRSIWIIGRSNYRLTMRRFSLFALVTLTAGLVCRGRFVVSAETFT